MPATETPTIGQVLADETMTLETLESEISSYDKPYVVYQQDGNYLGGIDYRQSFYLLQSYHERERAELLEQQRKLMDLNKDLEYERQRLSNIIIKNVELKQSESVSDPRKKGVQERPTTSKRKKISDDESSESYSENTEKYKRRIHHPIPSNKAREGETMEPKVYIYLTV